MIVRLTNSVSATSVRAKRPLKKLRLNPPLMGESKKKLTANVHLTLSVLPTKSAISSNKNVSIAQVERAPSIKIAPPVSTVSAKSAPKAAAAARAIPTHVRSTSSVVAVRVTPRSASVMMIAKMERPAIFNLVAAQALQLIVRFLVAETTKSVTT